jgi:hypothetical protein
VDEGSVSRETFRLPWTLPRATPDVSRETSGTFGNLNCFT